MAEREIVLKLKVDTSGVDQGLNNIEESLKGVNAEVDELGKAGKTDPFAKKLEELDKKLASGTMSIREMSKAVKEYQTIAVQAGQDSPIGQQALKQAADLKDRLGDLQTQVNNLGHDGANMQAALQLGGGVVAGYTAFQSVTALLGKENEDLQKTFVKLQAAQSALMAIEQLRSSLEKESFLMIKAKALQTNVLSAATAVYSTVVGASTGAMKLFRIALMSTGIGAIVVGLGLLIANFDKVQAFVKKAIAEFGNLRDMMLILLGPIGWVILAYQKLFSEEAKMANAREKASKQITDNYNKEVAQLKEKRRLEKESFDDKQTEFDLNIARLQAEGKSVNELTTQKLEAIVAEKKAVLQLNMDLINAMVERYTLEAALRGKSLDEFLKSVGISKDTTEKLIKDQIKAQEDAVFSAETELIAFRNEASKGVEAPVSFKFPDPEEIKLQSDQLWTTFNEMWQEYPQINIADKFEVEPETFELIPEEELDTALEKLDGFFAQLKVYRETGSENIKAELEESLKATQQVAQQALETLGAINDFANQISDNKIAKIEDTNSKELNASQSLYDSMLVSSEAQKEKELNQANLSAEQKKAIDKRYSDNQIRIEQQKAQAKFKIEMETALALDKINKKKFQRDKALRIANAVMDTASAVIKSVAASPVTFGLPFSAFAAVAGAAQIATIASQKFEGSAGSITPPNFGSVSGGGDSGGSDSGSGQNQTGSQQNNITTNTDNLINGTKPQKVILSMVELNEMQSEMNQIDAVSTIGGG